MLYQSRPEKTWSGRETCVAKRIDLHSAEGRDFQRLRFCYFVQQRQWVMPESAHSDLESDRYDDVAHHLGVFEDGTLMAYLRALPWHQERGFMLEHDFRSLLSNETLDGLHRGQSLEISRLVLASGLSPDAVLHITELLFKLLYQFCREEQMEHLYAVVEPGWLRRFQRCFHLPFQALGPSRRFPDGTRAVAAYAQISVLEQSLLTVDPLKLRWYQGQ